MPNRYRPTQARKEADRRYRQKHAEAIEIRNKKWYTADDGRLYRENKEQRQQNEQRWRTENSSKVNSYTAKRKAAIINATPTWADAVAIQLIYEECKQLSKITGSKYHVDHKYPLISDNVCGLHVAENLQILPSTDNLRKGNKTAEGEVYGVHPILER